MVKNLVDVSMADLIAKRDKLLRTHLRGALYARGIVGLTAKIIDEILDPAIEKAEKQFLDNLAKYQPQLLKKLRQKLSVKS